MNIYYGGMDITALVTEATIDRSISMAGAEARITAVYAPMDRFLPKINPACGGAVTVCADGETLFSGAVERVSYDAESLLLHMVCMERSSLLAKNEICGPLSGTAPEIARAVLLKVGLAEGTLWNQTGQVYLPPSCGRRCFSAIMAAYGGECFTEMQNGAVSVRKLNCRSYTLKTASLISLSSFSSIEALVTGAEVRGDDGAKLAEKYSQNLETSYGRRRRVFSLEGARSGAGGQAAAALSLPKRQAEAVIFGDPSGRIGAELHLDQGAYGAAGAYTVARIRHTLKEGLFLTTLGLTGS